MNVQVIETVAAMQAWATARRAEHKRIALVPTMGALHEGHASLIRKAREENDIVLVSIFVNPLQFAPQEDLNHYPKTFSADQNLCENLGVDAIFLPPGEDILTPSFGTQIQHAALARSLCSISRPHFFHGVVTIVVKLLNICQPHQAYFGEKDYQQYRIIETVTRELNMQVAIIPCALVREPDGLALSSRNQYLSAKEREAALLLSRSLHEAQAWIEQGERNAARIITRIRDSIASNALCRVDYVAIVDAEKLLDRSTLEGRLCIALAVHVGSTRLIDNILLEV